MDVYETGQDPCPRVALLVCELDAVRVRNAISDMSANEDDVLNLLSDALHDRSGVSAGDRSGKKG